MHAYLGRKVTSYTSFRVFVDLDLTTARTGSIGDYNNQLSHHSFFTFWNVRIVYSFLVMYTRLEAEIGRSYLGDRV